jgi:hypothetical protein
LSVSRTNNKNNTSSSSNATPSAINEAERKPFDGASFKQIFLQDATTWARVTSEKLPNRGPRARSQRGRRKTGTMRAKLDDRARENNGGGGGGATAGRW